MELTLLQRLRLLVEQLGLGRIGLGVKLVLLGFVLFLLFLWNGYRQNWQELWNLALAAKSVLAFVLGIALDQGIDWLVRSVPYTPLRPHDRDARWP